MSEPFDEIAVVVCHEGAPSNTYTIHDTHLNSVIEAIGRAITWRGLEDAIASELGKLNAGKPYRRFEKSRGRATTPGGETVVVVDMTAEKRIVITLE